MIPAHATTYDYDRFGNRIRAALAAGGTTRCDHDTVQYDSYYGRLPPGTPAAT